MMHRFSTPLPETLTDGDLVLSSFSPDDADPHQLSLHEVAKLQGEAQPAPGEDIRATIARWAIGRIDRRQFTYAIRVKERLVGGCELRASGDGVADISYWIFPAFRKRGLASRAVALLCTAAVQAGVAKICAQIDGDNIASRRVAEKAGFLPSPGSGQRRVFLRTAPLAT